MKRGIRLATSQKSREASSPPSRGRYSARTVRSVPSLWTPTGPRSYGYMSSYLRSLISLTSGPQLRRPFAFINSRMYVQRLKDFDEYTPEGEPVLDTFAEVQQRWHLWRRRYDLFIRQTSHRILSTVDEPQPEPEPDIFHQFARIDDGFLAWHFTLRDARGEAIANVNRTFRGFGREVGLSL